MIEQVVRELTEWIYICEEIQVVGREKEKRRSEVMACKYDMKLSFFLSSLHARAHAIIMGLVGAFSAEEQGRAAVTKLSRNIRSLKQPAVHSE